jgi:hypothetical protein
VKRPRRHVAALPLDRVVAFAGPYISVVAGAVASWLVAKANVLGIGGLDETNVATQVAGALTFLVVVVLSWVGQSRWLTGVQIALRSDARVASAALAAPSAPPSPPPVQPWPSRSAATASPFTRPPTIVVPEDAEIADADAVAAATAPAATPEDPPPAAAPAADAIPDGTPDELRPVMPSEVPLQGELDERDDEEKTKL